jgi:hypothetical protein
MATPIAAAFQSRPPVPTIGPIQLAGDDAVVKFTPDGVVTITARDGRVWRSTVAILFPPGPITGLTGRVVDGDGRPIPDAILHAVGPEGSSCSTHDVGSLTGPEGDFRMSLRPGLCLVWATKGPASTNAVLAEIRADLETPVLLVVP